MLTALRIVPSRSAARIDCAISIPTLSCASAVEAPRCGVKTRFGAARNGESSGSGSISKTSSAAGDYTDLVELSAAAEGKTVSVGGAFFGATPRIVSVNSRPVEARPHGVILVLENTDRPGIVGRIGTLLGEHNVNIATMSLSRNQAGGTALTILNLDNAPGEQLLQEIRASGDIHSAQVIQL